MFKPSYKGKETSEEQEIIQDYRAPGAQSSLVTRILQRPSLCQVNQEQRSESLSLTYPQRPR